MIKSMTGYGKINFVDENLNLDIEIKTINSRYLDLNIKMPNQFNYLENKIQKLIKKYIKRGRVDVYIRSKKQYIGKAEIIVDLDLAKKMYESLLSLAEYTGIEKNKIEMSNILKNDDILTFESEKLDENYIENILLTEVERATISLFEMREREGQSLYNDLMKNLDIIEKSKDNIKVYSKNIKEEIREKLISNIESILSKKIIDEDRLANEIVFYADRMDVNEEIIRLESHISQFRKILDLENSSGKKLDFITQEMLRETNTIGSKSSKIEILNNIIEMKTNIEKIKEQVQNIE